MSEFINQSFKNNIFDARYLIVSCFFPLLLLYAFPSFSQNKLRAEIYDARTNVPVEYANLKIYSIPDSAVFIGGFSDEKGIVVIEDISNGNYYGIITAFGFEDFIIHAIDIDERKNRFDLGKFFIQSESAQAFDEVVVRAEKEVIRTSFDKRVYATEEDMVSQGGSATDILNNIPSVEVDNDGNISLRGSGNVMILIDGRPSAMSGGAEGALDAIPASAIERVELITNPSAKYDPDGTAGIINIVLKKNRLRGTNTSIDLSAATGNLYNKSLNFNARNNDWNFFTNYSFRYQEGFRDNMNIRNGLVNDTLITLFQDRAGMDNRRSHTGKIGLDYKISSRQALGLSASGTYNDRWRTGDQFNLNSFNDTLNRYWRRTTYDPRNRQSVDLNADYKLDFEDGKGDLIAIATQSFGISDALGRYEEYFFLPSGQPLPEEFFYQFQTGISEESTFTGSIDVQRNQTDDFRYETGAKAIIRSQFRSNYLESLNQQTGEIEPNFDVINDFVFDEQILAVYGIAAHQINGFKYQVGMRLEQAFTQPRLLTTNEDFENNYFSAFPSAHIIYGEEEKKGEWSLSYSRRINRPNTWHLNPFPVFSDPLNLRQGNPAVQPEYINSLEAGYQKKWKNLTISGSLYFRQTVDKIQRVRQFFPNNVSVTTFANIAESYDFGSELIAIYSPFKWWKNIFSFNGFETRLNANVNGVNLRNSGFSYNVKYAGQFNFPDGKTTAQVNMQYIAPTFTVQGFFQRYAGLDLALARKFFDQKLSVGIRLTDVFDQQGFYLQVSDGPFIQESMYKWETRRLFLNLSYRFGRMEENKSRNRPSGSSSGGDGVDF